MEKMKEAYESILIVSCKNGEEAIAEVVGKFKKMIETGATLDSVEEWGKRKLAYLINKESEGYYVLFNFTCDAEFPAELDRVYNITDGVLRSLIVKRIEKSEAPAVVKTTEAPEAVETAEADAE
ncbi:MAG: 30S ribosomal protein S6 [Clostridia bacterium]|nr:30S ribosomal protein S6 [Clostridia bacterium]